VNIPLSSSRRSGGVRQLLVAADGGARGRGLPRHQPRSFYIYVAGAVSPRWNDSTASTEPAGPSTSTTQQHATAGDAHPLRVFILEFSNPPRLELHRPTHTMRGRASTDALAARRMGHLRHLIIRCWRRRVLAITTLIVAGSASAASACSTPCARRDPVLFEYVLVSSRTRSLHSLSSRRGVNPRRSRLLAQHSIRTGHRESSLGIPSSGSSPGAPMFVAGQSTRDAETSASSPCRRPSSPPSRVQLGGNHVSAGSIAFKGRPWPTLRLPISQSSSAE